MVEFAVDKFLMKKIQLMIKKVMDDDEDDNCLIFEGDTNVGKTNASVGVAHIVANATGRVFDNSRIFFDTAKAVDFAKRTREQIIIFDEPAFGGLKSEWRKNTQINLIKLLYTARIKRHFMIFNLVKFSKFSDDIIEKAIALIRIYKRNESQKERRYLYIPKKRIPALLDYWHRKHIRAYNKFAVGHGSLFRYVLPEIIDKAEYNKLKEESIEMIGEQQNKIKDKYKLEYDKVLQTALTYDFKKNPLIITSLTQFSEVILKRPASFLTRTRDKAQELGFLPIKKAKYCDLQPLIIDNGDYISEDSKVTNYNEEMVENGVAVKENAPTMVSQ